MSGHEVSAGVYCIYKDLTIKRIDLSTTQRVSSGYVANK